MGNKLSKIFVKNNLKYILILLNLIGLTVFVSGISIMYTNDNFQKGVNWFNSEKYEDSAKFLSLVENDIDSIFDYERYRDIFEKNGKFDEDAEIFSINDGPNLDVNYTLKDILLLAKKNGYYIDNSYNVVRNENLSDGDEFILRKYNVNWKKDNFVTNIKEPGESYSSLQELVEETLDKLSIYYNAYINIGQNNRNIYYYISYGDEVRTNKADLVNTDVKKYGKYIIIKDNDVNADTNFSKIPSNIYYQISCGLNNDAPDEEDTYHIADNIDYKVIIAINTYYPNFDSYYNEGLNYLKQRELYFYGSLMIFFGLLIMITSIIVYVFNINKFDRNSEIQRYNFDKIPFEIKCLIYIFLCILLWFLLERVGFKVIHLIIGRKHWYYAEKISLYICIYICSLILMFSFVHSLKSGSLWNCSLLKSFKEESYIYKKRYSFTKILLISYSLYVLINLTFIFFIFDKIMHGHTIVDRFVLIILIIVDIMFNIIVFHNIYRHSYMLDKISLSIDNLLNKKEYELNLEEFVGKGKDIAQKINNVGKGLEEALEESIKSERLKADLITNVSHDIRTPLTSIITYINIMKMENIDNDNIKEYLAILEKKSLHLRDLTEDLLEASKVSSGNININLNKLDFYELILQTNGEFEEKYKTKGLEIVFKPSVESAMIMADGSHLWRVLENIYNNAFNYSLPNSRVYVDLNIIENKAVFIMKNISNTPLNIEPDELTERFVRGDVARNTKGSGLGLSIAKSLTLSQGGSFEINIDGDLFKIIIIFDLTV